MSTQALAPLNESATARPPAHFDNGGVGQNLSKIVADVLAILDLQWRLFQVDARESFTQSRILIVALGLGLWIGVAATVLVLAGIAFGLQAATGWPAWGTTLLVGGVGGALAVVLLLTVAQALKKTLTVFERSRKEFGKNVEAFRASLTGNDSVART